ncbi:MAG: PhaM family polyhydroxyalkanoate granule multifunctional regulatory protein [Burkholderiales bacterium]
MSKLPDYFEMLRALGTMGTMGSVAEKLAQGVPNPFSHLMATDPAELDKKIQELQVVLLWLNAQVTAVELSVKTLEMQRDTLERFSGAKDAFREATDSAAKSAGAAAQSLKDMKGLASDDLARYAQALNPAQWMGMMSGDASAEKPKRARAKASAKSGAARTKRSTRTAAKKKP